jgi:hypothetical protein
MERSNCAVGVAKRRKSQKNYVLPLTKYQTTKTEKHHQLPAPTTNIQHQQLPTPATNGHSACPPPAGPEQADAFFFSFVRERVGLRSGGVSLRSPARAKLPRFVDMSLFQAPDAAMRSLPTNR